MPNKYNIYLHDTNEPDYFTRHQRAQSSGCVRLKEPEKMAQFVMQNEAGWNAERMKTLLADGKTRDIKITAPIPVYLLYYTVWVDDEGNIVYGNDIYDWDRPLINAIFQDRGFVIPK
jgi:murein L,D-transpeptidase YcbB/YkuD